MHISTERNRFTDIEKRHVVAREMREERIENLGLVGTNYYI